MSKVTVRSKKPGTERGGREKNYKIYAVDFHGSSLKAIRDEFLIMAKDGRRRNIIVIDLNEELRAHRRKAKASNLQFIDPVMVTLSTITERLQNYDNTTHLLEMDKKFNLYEYWLQNMKLASIPTVGKKHVAEKVADKKIPKTAKLPVVKEMGPPELICPKMVLKEHNRIGSEEKTLNLKFIEDSPPNVKLFIILLANNASKLYMDLLRYGEPLQAIVHFIPELSPYELLVPIKSSQVFLQRTIREIKSTIDDLRIPTMTKPVGIFQQQLPVISSCSARKHCELVYNELSWYFYDLEIIREQYQLYYYDVFREQNVAMDRRVNLQDLLTTAESLTIQGHFLHAPLPAAATDLATIAVFLEGLISTMHVPSDILTDYQIKLLSGGPSRRQSESCSRLCKSLATDYSNAFKSITKVSRFGRLAVERVNEAFYSLISYMNMDQFATIYHSCLEYNVIRRYLMPANSFDCLKPLEEELEPFYLPPYCKLYASHDATRLRLHRLLTTEYDHHAVHNLAGSFRLHHFKRNYNEIVQTEKTMIVPTRLCFRDFTIFQLETFLRDFIPPKPPKEQTVSQQIDAKSPQYIRRLSANFGISNDIFIRPPSLKAKKLQNMPPPPPPVVVPTPTESKTKAALNKKSPQVVSLPKANFSGEHVGLPHKHPLLYGYNLEDTLQEVAVKISCYHFEEGFLKRYEDRWCYDELNKNMIISLNETSINLFRPRHGLGISRQIHLRTKSDLNCRIYPSEDECGQIVLNYPNGLSVYFNGNTCEQQWSIQETMNFEKRRLFTPEGAIIVHYHAEDVIRVLRNNGEVYELFQYELAGEEEEGEGGGLGIFNDWNSNRTCYHVSQATNRDGVPPPKSATTTNTKRVSASSKKRQSTQVQPKETYAEDTISALKLDFTKSVKDFLTEKYEYELNFLNLIATKYDLNYIHMKVTTSVGRVLYMTNRGMMFEVKPYGNAEWHDYFANESYAMRDDGVKMIWTQDALKCFHANGSIITTKIDESYVNSEYPEVHPHLEPLHISQSSSHPSQNLEDIIPIIIEPDPTDEDLIVNLERNTKTQFDLEQLKAHYAKLQKEAQEAMEYEPEEEEHIEEKPPEDKRFVNYRNCDIMMQHANYAAINFVFLLNCAGRTRTYMYICAADDIRVQIVAAETQNTGEEDGLGGVLGVEELEVEVELEDISMKCSEVKKRRKIKTYEDPSLPDCYFIEMEEGVEEVKEDILKTKLKFNIGDNVEVRVDEESCQIRAIIERNDNICGKMCDILSLKFNYDDNIDWLFQEFAQIISKFKNYEKQVSKELFFIDNQTSNCEMQGFEFYNTLPTLGPHSLVASNVITDMSTIENISDQISNRYDWYEKDMKKFPRFPKREYKYKYPYIPLVQAVNTFCIIPRALQSTDVITKFLAPFDKVNFKRMRSHVKQAMEYHLRPYLRFKLVQLGSKRNWRLRHKEHMRRLIVEEQRKGLYHAMLKHKVYPKYHEFISKFFGHVKNINFFEYVTYQCMPKEAEVRIKTAQKSTSLSPRK